MALRFSYFLGLSGSSDCPSGPYGGEIQNGSRDTAVALRTRFWMHESVPERTRKRARKSLVLQTHIWTGGSRYERHTLIEGETPAERTNQRCGYN